MDNGDIKGLIRDLMKDFDASRLTRLAVEIGGAKISMEKEPAFAAPQSPPAGAETADAARKDGAPGDAAPASEGHAVTAPIVGTFYQSSSPEKLPFVKPGDSVRPGDVLCIIEAMKIMNEITCDRAGKIAEVCVKDGAMVEFGQALFRISGE